MEEEDRKDRRLIRKLVLTMEDFYWFGALQDELLEWRTNLERQMSIKAGLETGRNTGGHTVIRVKCCKRLVKKLDLDS